MRRPRVEDNDILAPPRHRTEPMEFPFFLNRVVSLFATKRTKTQNPPDKLLSQKNNIKKVLIPSIFSVAGEVSLFTFL
jgi:hypothetical protein